MLQTENLGSQSITSLARWLLCFSERSLTQVLSLKTAHLGTLSTATLRCPPRLPSFQQRLNIIVEPVCKFAMPMGAMMTDLPKPLPIDQPATAAASQSFTLGAIAATRYACKMRLQPARLRDLVAVAQVSKLADVDHEQPRLVAPQQLDFFSSIVEHRCGHRFTKPRVSWACRVSIIFAQAHVFRDRSGGCGCDLNCVCAQYELTHQRPAAGLVL